MREWSTVVVLRLRPSPRVSAALAAIHAGAMACVMASALPWAAKAVLAPLVAAWAWRSVALHGTRRAAPSIATIAWDRQGRWRLLRRDGRVLDARLAGGGFCHPLLLVLPLHAGRRRRVWLLVTPDMTDADALRRLRVRLRCEPPPRNPDPVC